MDINVIFVIFCAIMHFSASNHLPMDAVQIKGDYIIGLMLKIRDPYGKTCGNITDNGIRRVAMAIYAIKDVNEKILRPHNIKLGLEVRDYCLQSSYAIASALAFNSNSQYFRSLQPKKLIENRTIGVFNPEDNISINSYLQAIFSELKMPYLGLLQTPEKLKGKKHTYIEIKTEMYRELKVILDVISHFQWSSIALIVSKDYIHEKNLMKFRELALKRGICIAKEVTVNSPNDNFDENIQLLNENVFINVVVCLGESWTAIQVLKSVKRLHLSHRFTFIGGSSWTESAWSDQGLSEEAWGSIVVKAKTEHISDFEDYYKNLDPTDDGNDWLIEYWEQKFNCFYRNRRSDTQSRCTGSEVLSLTECNLQDLKLHSIHRTISIMGLALKQFFSSETCSKSSDCTVTNYDYPAYLMQLKDIAKRGRISRSSDQLYSNVVLFNAHILNYQKAANNHSDYEIIGSWSPSGLNISGQYQLKKNGSVGRECAVCKSGHYKIFNADTHKLDACCVPCAPCNESQIVSANGSSCLACSDGWWPNENQTHCVKNIPRYTSWGAFESMVACLLATMGLIVSGFVLYCFIKYYDTPVLQAGLRSLCLIILLGIIMAHLSVFAFVAKPSVVTCTIISTIPGLSFSMIYASLMTKINRILMIVKISENKTPPRYFAMLSTKPLLIITSSLLVIETIILCALTATEDSLPHYEHISPRKTELTCTSSHGTLLRQLAFAMLLCFYSINNVTKIRTVNANLNEAQSIAYAMYTTFITWISGIIVYSINRYEVVHLSIAITLNASIILLFIFGPKLYVIYWRPDKNNNDLLIMNKCVDMYCLSRRELEKYARKTCSVGTQTDPVPEKHFKDNFAIISNIKVNN